MKIDAVTRGIVIASTVAAALAEVYLATEYAPQILWIALIGFAILLAIGSRVRQIALPLLLAATYVAPVLLLIFNDGQKFSLDIVWLLPLLGLILSGRDLLRWSLPLRWQWPLVTWALIVSVAWPIVFLREADFRLWILPLERVSNTSIGISPWQVGENVAYFVLAHNAGILFIDALFRWYAGAYDRFRREVATPLALMAAIAALVAVYQGFVDLSFLNSHFWTYMIRASGTLADPNKLGSVAAFWTIGAIVLARRLPKPWPAAITVIATVLGITAVWLCGSRTGLAALAISIVIAMIEAVRGWRAGRAPLNLRRVVISAAAVLLLGVGLVFVLQKASTHTIVQRGALFYVPFYGDHTLRQTANEWLWERFGYGPAAIEMIKEHPIDGIGIGVFHSQATDFGKLAGYAIPQPDNAQNWFRHTFAELGLLGSVPVMWWCVVFIMLMFTRPRGDGVAFGMIRGVLIGFGFASMFGMPSQAMAITLTFWVFAFWLFQEGTGAGDTGAGIREPGAGIRDQGTAWSRTEVIAAAMLIAVHFGATTIDAFGDLRPRERAQRFNWYYRYGYVQPDDVEKDPGGNPVGRRWTMKQSLAVIPVKGKVLKFAAWVDHPDADVKPVHTQVWADSVLVYEGNLKRTPLFLDIPATPGKQFMILETKIDRLFRPSDSGRRDRRELGLSIRDWVWE
jgi:O-antigen ligase